MQNLHPGNVREQTHNRLFVFYLFIERPADLIQLQLETVHEQTYFLSLQTHDVKHLTP